MQETNEYKIFFTHEHINEMIRIQKTETPISELIINWCDFMSWLTKNNYWRIDPNNHNDIFEIREPINVAVDAIKDKFSPESYPGKEMMEKYLHSMLSMCLLTILNSIKQQSNIDISEIDTTIALADITIMGNRFFEIVNKLSQKTLDSSLEGMNLQQKLGSLTGEKLDNSISEALSNKGFNSSISELIDKAKQFQPEMDAFTPASYNTLYEMIGYKKDNVHATYDAKKSDNQHLIFGLRSDIFITHDRKLYFRTIETQRNFPENKTCIIFAQNAIDELRKISG